MNYYGFIALAGIVSISLYIFNTRFQFLKNEWWKQTLILAISTLLAFFISGIFSYFIHSDLWNEKDGFLEALRNFQYYITLVSFLLSSLVLFKLTKQDLQMYNKIVPSLVIFSAIARLGCLVAGCCGGITINGFIIPIVELELLFAFIFFNLLCFKIPTNRVIIYLFSYSSFRFIADFFRDNSGISKILIFTPTQWVALSLVLIIAILLLPEKKGKSGERKEPIYEK